MSRAAFTNRTGMNAERVQLRRIKGWRKPEGCIVVVQRGHLQRQRPAAGVRWTKPCHADVLLKLANGMEGQ